MTCSLWRIVAIHAPHVEKWPPLYLSAIPVNELIQLEDNDDDDVLTRGPTYGVGIIALLLGVINAIAVFVSYRHGGDGPIFSRIKARNAPTALRTAPFVENITSDPRLAYGSTAASVAWCNVVVERSTTYPWRGKVRR